MGAKSDSEGQYRDAKLAKICKYGCRPKKENANICKIDFPVLCTFTLFNTGFCTFLQSLRSECICASIVKYPFYVSSFCFLVHLIS